MAYIHYQVVTPPETEPVSLDAVKLHLRLIPGDDSEDEQIITPLITMAREFCENVTGRALSPQTIAAYPPSDMQRVLLPMPPLVEVERINTYDEAGNSRTLAQDAYTVDTVDGLVTLGTLPGNLRTHNPVEIIYRTGRENIPGPIRQAILLLVGHYYENREAVKVGAIASIEVQLTAKTLLNQYKVWWF